MVTFEWCTFVWSNLLWSVAHRHTHTHTQTFHLWVRQAVARYEMSANKSNCLDTNTSCRVCVEVEVVGEELGCERASEEPLCTWSGQPHQHEFPWSSRTRWCRLEKETTTVCLCVSTGKETTFYAYSIVVDCACIGPNRATRKDMTSMEREPIIIIIIRNDKEAIQYHKQIDNINKEGAYQSRLAIVVGSYLTTALCVISSAVFVCYDITQQTLYIIISTSRLGSQGHCCY